MPLGRQKVTMEPAIAVCDPSRKTGAPPGAPVWWSMLRLCRTDSEVVDHAEREDARIGSRGET